MIEKIKKYDKKMKRDRYSEKGCKKQGSQFDVIS